MKLYHSAGIIFALTFLALAIGLSADNPGAFINIPGLLIVVGGTFTAILVSFPIKDALRAFKQARVLTESTQLEVNKDINTLVAFSKLWFRHQYKQIDSELEQLNNGFMQKGLQMVRDRQSHEDVMAMLNWKISQYRSSETAVINIFRSMATFAPAFGMVGSLVGLVNMLQGMEGGEIASVTSDMAIALITTFYGLLMSNLIFKPIATKLEQRRNAKTMQLSMIAEGIALIQQQRTPSVIQDTLNSFIQGQQYQQENPMPENKSLMNKLGLKPV